MANHIRKNTINNLFSFLMYYFRLAVSIGGNFDNELVTNNVDDNLKVQQLQVALRKVLSTPEYHNTLIVLDKLRCLNIVNYFDLGCKLFTTTCDLNFVPQSNCRVVIKVSFCRVVLLLQPLEMCLFFFS